MFSKQQTMVYKGTKNFINNKKFCHDKTGAKSVQKEIDTAIKVCKDRYKQKVENMFKRDAKSAWKGIKQLTDMKESKGKHIINNSKDFCNDLNVFYSRFDKCDFS